jgi:proteasome lid subunit RPN8/RPN11
MQQAIKLNKEQKEAIAKAAKACYPEEMCGVLLEDSFICIENTHEDRLNHFRIPAKELVQYLGGIKAIVHSHTLKQKRPSRLDLRTPSCEDIQAQQQASVPFLIVGTDGTNVLDALQYPKPLGGELLRRPFIWFIHDCYSLVQDYYFNEFGVELPPHKASKDFKDIRDCDDVFEEHILSYGFKREAKLEGIKNGDLLLLDGIHGGRRNHLGIYHNGIVIHQKDMSVEEPMEHFVGRIHCRLVYEG